MPHLSPMSWALVPLIFWALMLLLSSLLWWTPQVKFPTIKPSGSAYSNKWSW